MKRLDEVFPGMLLCSDDVENWFLITQLVPMSLYNDHYHYFKNKRSWECFSTDPFYYLEILWDNLDISIPITKKKSLNKIDRMTEELKRETERLKHPLNTNEYRY